MNVWMDEWINELKDGWMECCVIELCLQWANSLMISPNGNQFLSITFNIIICIFKRIQPFTSPHSVAQLLNPNWYNWRSLPGSTVWLALDRYPHITLGQNHTYADMEVDPWWPCGIYLVLSHNTLLCLLQFVFPWPDQWRLSSQPEVMTLNTWGEFLWSSSTTTVFFSLDIS